MSYVIEQDRLFDEVNIVERTFHGESIDEPRYIFTCACVLAEPLFYYFDATRYERLYYRRTDARVGVVIGAFGRGGCLFNWYTERHLRRPERNN